jgi:hypothetical protein
MSGSQPGDIGYAIHRTVQPRKQREPVAALSFIFGIDHYVIEKIIHWHFQRGQGLQ